MTWVFYPQVISFTIICIMELQAISTGCGLPGPGTSGFVHSVFERAINLSSNQEYGLLTTITSEDVDLPQGIRVKIPVGSSFEMIRVGESFQFSKTACKVGPLNIQLEDARHWFCDLPSLSVNLNQPVVLSVWKTAWTELIKRQETVVASLRAKYLFNSPKHVESSLSNLLVKAIRKLIDAVQNFDLNTAIDGSVSLIGLGSGLTPTGDDFLVGFLAGLFCQWNRSENFPIFCESLGSQIILRSQETNPISRTYLHYAAQGQVSSLLEGLAREINSPTQAQAILRKTDQALKVGATSGMDGVTGLLVGLGCFEKPWDC